MGAHLDLETLEPQKFQNVQQRLEAEGVRFLPYYTLNDPDKHARGQALHAEAKRDMPLFEPVATADFNDVEVVSKASAVCASNTRNSTPQARSQAASSSSRRS